MTYIGYVKLEGIDEPRFFTTEAESYALAVLAIENYYDDYVIEELTITDHVMGFQETKVTMYC